MEAIQAKALLAVIATAPMTMAQMVANRPLVSAIAELQAIVGEAAALGPVAQDVYIWCEAAKKVETIKLVRCLIGYGLKEAKDLVDEINPHSQSGWFGPIYRTTDVEGMKQAAERFGYASERYIQFRC
jgi:ribosomal protein L7/L12